MLKASEVEGFLIAAPEVHHGVTQNRLADLTRINETLFLNPFEFAYQHPNVRSVSIEQTDDTDDVTLVSRESDADPVPLVLVFERRDITYAFCALWRAEQREFFQYYRLVFPRAEHFLATIARQ